MTITTLILWCLFGSAVIFLIRVKLAEGHDVTRADLMFALLFGFAWPLVLFAMLLLSMVLSSWWSRPIIRGKNQ